MGTRRLAGRDGDTAGQLTYRVRRPQRASGAEGGTLRIWDLERGAAVATVEGHRGAVLVVAALAGGRVVSGADDGTLRIWDLERGAAAADDGG